MKSKIVVLALLLFQLPILSFGTELQQVEKPKDLVVTFAGDYGATENTKNVLKKIGEISPEIHFAVGDLSYEQLSEPDWCKFVHSYLPKTPFLLLSGNHESGAGKDKGGNIAEFAKCLPYNYTFPLHGEYTREYYVDVPAKKPLARFIMISPDLQFPGETYEYAKGNAHAKWLDGAIKSAKKEGIKWVIVGMHKVCITTEGKTCEVGTELIEQLIKNSVDIVVSGHVHAYERTYPLSCMKPDKFDPTCLAAKGTIFVTNGTGGTHNRDLNKNDSEAEYFAKTYGKNSGDYYGPLRVEINETRLKGQYIDSATGKVLDEFVVIK